MTTYIKVTHREPGFHFWPNPPKEAPNFLHNRHRHIFHFSLKIKVSSTRSTTKRLKEFFTIQKELERVLESFYGHSLYGLEFDNRSCEMIAEDLLDHFKHAVEVEVSEDGENSAICIR